MRNSNPFHRRIAYSAGSFSVNLFTQTFATYVVFYYVDQLQANPDWIALMMVLLGLLNAFLNPLLGHLSDATRTRFGRRIPYIAVGALPFALSFVLLFSPQVKHQDLILYFFCVALVYDISFVFVALNWTALFPSMFSTLQERSSASAWRQAFGILGTIVGVALPPILYGSIGWTHMAWLFGGLGLAAIVISLFGARESKESILSHTSVPLWQAVKWTFVNRSFVTYVLTSFFIQFPFILIPSVTPFFTKYVLGVGDEFTTMLLGSVFLVALPFLYVWSAVARRLGARSALTISACIFALSLMPYAFLHSPLAALWMTVPMGIGISGMFVLLDVLISDVIDEDEMRSGIRREGMYYGVQGFVVRFGVTLQALALSHVLTSTGYVPGHLLQAPAMLAGVRDLLSVVPVASLVISLVCLRLYPLHGERLAAVVHFRTQGSRQQPAVLALSATHSCILDVSPSAE